MSENSERRAIISKDTLIPIGLVVTICSAVWFSSALNTRLTYVEKRQDQMEAKLDDIPTRTEFQALQNTIEGIRKDIQGYIQSNATK